MHVALARHFLWFAEDQRHREGGISPVKAKKCDTSKG